MSAAEDEISLALTPGQVAQVLAMAAADGERSLLPDGLEDPRELIVSPLLENPKISRSLLVGLLVLISFPVSGGDRGNKEVAQELGLAASTTHRYINTLVAAGLLEQDSVTRRYLRTRFSGRHGPQSSYNNGSGG